MNSPDSHTHPITSERTTRARGNWALTSDAFEKLLDSFSQDRNEAGAQYEIIRRKLIRFFEWRAIGSADEHADETINRVARRIYEGQIIDNLKSYFYGVARMVFMEALKDREQAPVAIEDALLVIRDKSSEVTENEPDPRVMCFDRCLGSLPSENRTLIVTYYREEKRAKIELRQQLADRLQIPLNALRIRAHRIRVNLEKCIKTCLQAPPGGEMKSDF